MRHLSVLVLILASFGAVIAGAAETRIDVISPKDGSRLDSRSRFMLDYQVTGGSGSDHAHLYVDGKETTLLRQTKGSITLGPLARGNHEICARMVNKNHTPIGVERCVKVIAE